MENPKTLEINCETGEQIVRALTDEEYAQRSIIAEQNKND